MRATGIGLLVVAGLFLGIPDVYAQQEKEKKWNPYSGQWETPRPTEQRWNPYSGQFEAAPPGAVLRYNSKTFRYGWEAPPSTSEAPAYSPGWEATRDALDSLYRPPPEVPAQPSEVFVPEPVRPKPPAWQGFPPGAVYNEETKRFEYRK